jgi:hypothetical protein
VSSVIFISAVVLAAPTPDASLHGRVRVVERSGSVITDAGFGGYELHIERDVNWMTRKSGHLILRQGAHTILKLEERYKPQLYVWRGGELMAPDSEPSFDSIIEVARDITGDGIPDLLLTDEPAGGGNAVMTTWTVVSLGSLNRVIAELGGNGEGQWRYVPGQKLPVFETTEGWPFWECYCHWCIGAPVTVRYRDGAFRFAMDLMQKRAPSLDSLKEIASTIPVQGDCPPDALPNKMLELIFSGNAVSAYRLFDLAWPGDSAKKRDFRSAFVKRLEQSGYCRDVRCR